MKKAAIIIWLSLLCVWTTTIYAADFEALSPKQTASLAAIKHKIDGVHELAAAGTISAAQAREATERYLQEAQSIGGQQIGLEDLASVPDGIDPADSVWLSKAAQRLAGWMTFGNTVITIGVLGFVVGFLIIFRQAFIDLLRVFKKIPVLVYEVAVYVFGLTMVAGGRFWMPADGHYLGLFGCLMLAGGVVFSFAYHAPARKQNPSVFFLILTGIFASGALFYSSALIGGFAVLSLIGTLSLEDAMGSLSNLIGFEDEGAVARVTTVSYLIIAGLIVIRAGGTLVPELQIFEPGMLYLGSFGGYTGMLISASYWFDDKNSGKYFSRQIVAIFFGAAAFVCGLTFGIPELLKIGGTFFALYLLEKILEIISRLNISNAYTLGGVIIFLSAMLSGAGMLVVRNRELFSKYLLFL